MICDSEPNVSVGNLSKCVNLIKTRLFKTRRMISKVLYKINLHKFITSNKESKLRVHVYERGARHCVSYNRLFPWIVNEVLQVSLGKVNYYINGDDIVIKFLADLTNNKEVNYHTIVLTLNNPPTTGISPEVSSRTETIHVKTKDKFVRIAKVGY